MAKRKTAMDQLMFTTSQWLFGLIGVVLIAIGLYGMMH